MAIVKDQGSIANKINGILADFIAKLLGRRINYSLRYYHHRHRWPNFKTPHDLSERILSAMLKQDFLKYGQYADKIKVREYVQSKGLGSLLLEQYAVWDTPEQIDFSQLPERFIIKTNNGCGGHYICTDKNLDNQSEVRQLMSEDLDVSLLALTEPHYATIEPKIFVEELMGDGFNLPEDYKFYCINGKVDHVMVICDRKNGERKVITMSKDWRVLDYITKYKKPDHAPEKPDNFDKMVECAEILSKDFEFVRVDLYDVDSRIIFGELTFSPNGGLFYSYTTKAIDIIGSHFNS